MRPHFDSRSKVFELDPCGGFGKVCLVYNDLKAGEEKNRTSILFGFDFVFCVLVDYNSLLKKPFFIKADF